MPYAKDLCFATYARTLQKYFTVQPKDPALVESLMEYMVYQEDVLNLYGNPLKFDSKVASLLLNRQRNVNEEIRDAALDKEIAKGAEGFFEKKIVPKINEYLVIDLLDDVKKLVLGATNVGNTRKQQLLENADSEHLAKFLADVYIYSLTIQNKASTEIQTAESALTASRPDPDLEKIVNTVLMTLSSADSFENLEFHHFKDTQIGAVARQLAESGKMSLMDMYHCKNFIEIAEKADRILQKERAGVDGQDAYRQKFDFDWFLRFFESAGSISNEKMQELWAKVLAGEIRHQGSFSLRAVETLRNMTVSEAETFQRASRLIMSETDGSRFIFCDEGLTDFKLNERHGLSADDILMLEECGLISALRMDNTVDLGTEAGGFIMGDVILLFKNTQAHGTDFHYKSYPLSHVALQLIPVIQDYEDTDYLIELGENLKEEYGGAIDISAHEVLGYGEDGEIAVDEDTDLLAGGSAF